MENILLLNQIEVEVKKFVMDLKSKKIKRISLGKGKYATPVWSPRGDLIAFTKLSGGEFYIGVMYTDGKGESCL